MFYQFSHLRKIEYINLELYQLVIVSLAETVELLVDMNAAPCVRGGISALSLSELLGFPVAESLSLADFLMEEVGVDFLQAHILDAEFLSHILQLDEISRLEIASAMQLQEVIMPRQSPLLAPFYPPGIG